MLPWSDPKFRHATVEDSLYLSKILADMGIDALEVSGGTAGSGDKTPARMKIHTPDSIKYKFWVS